MILPNTLKQASKAACPLNLPKLLTIKLFDPTDIPKECVALQGAAAVCPLALLFSLLPAVAPAEIAPPASPGHIDKEAMCFTPGDSIRSRLQFCS